MNNQSPFKLILIIIWFFSFFNLSADDNNVNKICQIGTYSSFDSMNAAVVDLRYGVLFEHFVIEDNFPLLETTVDINGILVFHESIEPFIEVTPGIGINFLLRINIIPINRDRIFIEGGYGIIGYAKPYPSGGTIVNGARHLGIGYSIKTDFNNSIFIISRWYHNSNADIVGRDRNPGLDTLGISYGMTF